MLSLIKQSFTDFEIVIADDGSGPEIARLLNTFQAKLKYPVQHVWHEDLGFRKTIIANQAISKSKADYLVFIDGDCILHPRFIERHYLRKKPGRVQAGRRVKLNEALSNRLTRQHLESGALFNHSFWLNETEDTRSKHRGHYLPFIYPFVNWQKKDYWIMGCNFSVFKDDLLAVNGYDERIIGRGLEDVNLTQRLILNGVQIKRITYEAIQFHLFHRSDPIPHSQEVIDTFSHPKQPWAVEGISKKPE